MSQHYPQDFIKNQKQKLLMLKQEILNSMRTKIDDDILVSPDQTVEDGDQAQTYLSQNVTFGLREREMKRLREVEAALERIERGVYGICEETDEPIGKKRLEKMPWTRLSIEAAEALEREMAKTRAS